MLDQYNGSTACIFAISREGTGSTFESRRLSPARVKDSRETVFVVRCGTGALIIGRARMNTAKDGSKGVLPEGLRLRFLKPAQVKWIDDLLSQLGEYGEIHLVIQHGELRYINKVESFKAWKNDEES